MVTEYHYITVMIPHVQQQIAGMKRKQKQESDLYLHTNKKQSLLQIQKDLLVKAVSSNEGTSSWKLLVFDNYNRGIVSSQLKMKDLRDNYITLYLNIADNRQQIHGVTVMYLVQPTLENIEIIASDLLQDLYTSVYIHFSSEPSPNILSTLAKKLTSAKKNSVISRIAKIEYSCVGYYSIDNSMAILPTQVEILNLLASLNLQPIFVFNPSHEQSKSLVERLKTKLTTITSAFLKQAQSPSSGAAANQNYALLYIFNRESDYFPMLAHGITYASLMENIYKINKTGSKVTKNKENFELSLQDQIWVTKKNFLISQMQLDKQSNQISAKRMGLSSEQYTQSNEKYKKIQWHLSNAGDLISEAKKRRLNQFYEAELQIYNKSIISKDLKRDMLTLLKEAPESEDKIRLMLIYILYADHIDEAQQFEQVFPEITKNAKYSEWREKKMKGIISQSTSNKYIKKFAKGIWKNIITGEKKFRVTKELEKIKGADFTQLIDGGLAVESISTIPNNLKIQRNIVYCLGGACFHEYANLMEFSPDALYSGDQLISYREVI